jgi:hypothetical protein
VVGWSQTRQKGVEWIKASLSGEHALGGKIFHRKDKNVKPHRTRIVSGEMKNREKTQNDVRSDKDIKKVKGFRKHQHALGGD